MSFEEFNREVNDRRKEQGGKYFNPTRVKDGRVKGKIVHVKSRDKVYEGAVVLVRSGPNEGKPRKEWLFTLDNEGNKVKFPANENAQYAIMVAMEGRQFEEGAFLEVWVTEDPKKKTEQATYKASYTSPSTGDPFGGSDATPF